MVWLKTILRELASGNSVQIVTRGGSMRPRIEEGQTITVAPASASEVVIGDIVLVRIRRNQFLTHLVKDIQDSRFLIANNLGKDDGWVGAEAIYGKVVHIGDNPNFSGITVEEPVDD